MNWFQNEEFWREFFPVLFPAKTISEATDQVRELLTLTKFDGHSVLDLCCGPGRHALALAKQGFKVTGVDLSPYLLSRARSHASELGLTVEWVEEDMRAFRRNEAFDLICNMTTSFGYFDKEEENLLVLRNVWESLRYGGKFVIDSVGKEILARKWRDCFCSTFPDEVMLIRRSEIRDDCCRVYNEWTLVKRHEIHKFRYHHALYSGLELKERLISAGFAEVQLFGDFSGSPYGIDAPRLIVVARKVEHRALS